MATATGPATTTEPLAAMAEAARWAPSVHNTQPWRFEVWRAGPAPGEAVGLMIFEDADRSLPVLDPYGRLRAISCGAAVANAEVACRAKGFSPVVDWLPDASRPDLVAVVRPDRPHQEQTDVRRLADAVMTRRTHRRVHRHERLDPDTLASLRHEVTTAGAEMTVLDEAARRHLAILLVQAMSVQSGSPEIVDEVDSWVRGVGPGEQEREDGVPVASLGTGPFPIDSLAHEVMDVERLSSEDVDQALSWSTTVAISTVGDRRRDWLNAGRALQRMWLHATVDGFVLAFADQATQLADTRRRLPEALDILGHVQLVVRLGRPLVDVPPTPRRPIAEVLT
ncbi:MAG TPA: hypothetical protein VFX41_07645 [Actinomycetales bacterium]|jgi:hypothetical protein|nr:hypothetical protein [Actinomycetales bacterium]